MRELEPLEVKRADEAQPAVRAPAAPGALTGLDPGRAGAMVLTMQQGHGNAYVSRMLAGGSASTAVLARDELQPLTPFGGGPMSPFDMGGAQARVTPEGASHGTPEDQLRVAKYADAPIVAGPEVPQPFTIDVPTYAPKPEGWRSSTQGPGGLRPPYDFPDRDGRRPTGPPVMAVAAEAQRREVWSAYRSVVAEAVGSHNALVMPIATYEGFAKDPTVAAQGFSLPDEADKAMKQVVPRTSASGITVGGLFTPAGGAKPVTDVQTQGLDDNFARSKRSNRVEEQRLKIDAADLDVQAQLETMKKVVLESEKAGFDLQAAAAGVKGFEAEETKRQGEKELKAAKDAAEELTTWIGRGLKAVSMMSGVLAPIVIAGEAVSAVADAGSDSKSSGGGALGKVKSVADSGITSTIAGRIVDFVSKSDIDAATAKIAKAEKDINAAKGTQVRATESGAEKGFAASLIAIKKASIELEKKMKLREAALMAFGNAAAAAGGGSQKEQDRVRGIVQAMPVVERVIASTDNIQAAIKVPAHDDNAGRGLNLALYAGYDDAPRFLRTVGLVRGYKQRFTGVRDEWQQRLDSLRKAVNAMSASDQGP